MLAVFNESSMNENVAGAFTRAQRVSQPCYVLVSVWLFSDFADKLNIRTTNRSTLCSVSLFFWVFLHLPNEKIHVNKCGLKIFLVLFILANKESHYYPGISSRFPLGFFSKHRLCSSEGSIFHQCCFSVAIKMARGNISRGMSQKRIKNNLRVHLGPCAYRSHSIKMQTEIGANSQLPTFKSNKHGSIPDLGLC